VGYAIFARLKTGWIPWLVSDDIWSLNLVDENLNAPYVRQLSTNRIGGLPAGFGRRVAI